MTTTDHTRAIRDVIAERLRQQTEEGFDAAHDDKQTAHQLASAAAAYASYAAMSDRYRTEYDGVPVVLLGLDEVWWKPTTRRRDLVKAAALIIAEIERLDRAAEDTAITHCEACGHAIQDGGAYLPGSEASLCAACAPTWQLMIDEPDAFVDDDGYPLTPEAARAFYDAHIAAGGQPTDSMARVR